MSLSSATQGQQDVNAGTSRRVIGVEPAARDVDLDEVPLKRSGKSHCWSEMGWFGYVVSPALGQAKS